jgi:hypothetical protein
MSYLRPQLLEDNDLYVVRLKELEMTKRTTSLIYGDPNLLVPSVRYLIEETIAYFSRGARRTTELSPP